jgi:hypothetical protein
VRNSLVRYSRAGDVFHYRWAARRCLRLLDLNSPLECVTIEGSREDQQAGEYVIDVAEYSRSNEKVDAVDYFQLKHSTVRTRVRIGSGELKKTLKGFVDRYKATLREPSRDERRITFSVVTNRRISHCVKDTVSRIANGHNANPKVQRQLQNLTRLRGPRLQHFCAALRFIDAEGDYVVQKERLRSEVTEYIAGFVHNDQIDALVALVQDRALPNSDTGEIHREDVFSRLGVSSERELFPAPPRFESLQNPIHREQHEEILELIETTDKPLLIHAAGGVGKTVVARQLADSLPEGSFGIVYDSFGGGTYRNASEPRHRASDGLIQIANELAVRQAPAAAGDDAVFHGELALVDAHRRRGQIENRIQHVAGCQFAGGAGQTAFHRFGHIGPLRRSASVRCDSVRKETDNCGSLRDAGGDV